MFKIENSKVYFRNGLVPYGEANLSITSSPVLYGLAVYTVFNVRWDNAKKRLLIFRLADHYRRLCDSARIMDFTPFDQIMSYPEFKKVIYQLLVKNDVRENALVRASLFIDENIAGTKSHGLKTSFSAYIYPMAQFYPEAGVNVCVSSWQRTPDNAIPSRAKVNGSYANATLMKNEALLNGYDEAIALDAEGHVTEGTVANLFMVRKGELITPDQSADILEGITRDSLIQIAKKLNIHVKQRPVDRSELYVAEELFYCGSSARIAAILSVDKRPVGDKMSGPITIQLSEAYDKAQLGILEGFSDWLDVVTVS